MIEQQVEIMEKDTEGLEDSRQSQGNPRRIKPAYYLPETKTYQEEIGRFRHKRFLRCIAKSLRFADVHNGIITGLATVVLAYLTFSLATDSGRQIEEMKAQRILTMTQLRARFRRERPIFHPVGPDDKYIQAPGTKIIYWDVNPWWTNVGNTEALEFISWWDIKIIDIETAPKPIDCPKSILPKGPIASSVVGHDSQITEIAKSLSPEIAVEAIGPNPKKVIFFLGYAKYKDIFGASHHFDWCLLMAPHDLSRSDFSPLRVREDAD